MTAIALIEAPASDDAPEAQPSASPLLDQLQTGLPPLLSVVPQAGRAVYVLRHFSLPVLHIRKVKVRRV